ncbi:heme-binding domain-containing protein [Ferruginibacter lapsinanis]|uniref:heme-binding domain-containing protein n=1 Tax=Ferruginibacter lapsinanis TaxID=563172 RepID=UPI001E44CEA1|nr:heme-binding domain-containing protein [Ferruginibacter lapsinanis]UEG51164.1 heme-binding domain-containing protein [Ferruginibacter lapsinanis]
MKKKIKVFLLILLCAFVIIQFFHPAKNEDTKQDGVIKDIATVFSVPDSVKNILQTSCYDCHSNSTKYPWYASFQPVDWWLNNHIQEGKKELNFSEFASYRIRRQYKKFDEIIKEVKEDEMPLSSYTLIHTDAKLSDGQKKLLIDWATGLRAQMKAQYPADSLVKK